MRVLSNTFLILWELTFSMFLEVYGFLLHAKYLRSPYLWNVCVFPNFFRTMDDFFLHILGIVWISKSCEIYKKPLHLEYLYFPIRFPYYGNTFSPCFGDKATTVKMNKRLLFPLPFPIRCLCETLH